MDRTEQKKAHIRGYLLLLVEEGVFQGARGGMGVVTAAVGAFGRDVGVVVGEMAQEFGQMGGNKLAASVVGAGARVLSTIGERGLKQALVDLFASK